MRMLPLVLAIAAVAGCARPAVSPPSLAPRAVEAIDPRVPIPDGGPLAPVDAALAARLAALVAEARSGDAAFRNAAADAERLSAAAGAPQSESWIAAQQALSIAVAARAPTTRAVGDIDELAATTIARTGFIAPADQQAIEAAAAEVARLASAQAARIDSIQARLRG